MKIDTAAIAGLGGVGAMYGSMMLKALGRGNVFAISDPDRAERYKRDGVFVDGVRHDFVYWKPEEAEPVDLLIFATKYYSLDQAIEESRGAVGPDTIVMSFLNGVTSEDRIAEKMHPNHLLYTTGQALNGPIRTANRLCARIPGQEDPRR